MTTPQILAGCVAGLGLVVPAIAQSQEQSGQSQHPATQPSAQIISEQQSIQGKVADIRTFQIQGAKQSHVLAKIQALGQTTIADLGPKASLDRQLGGKQLQQGQEISVSGVPGRINGKPVLIARQVTPPQATAAVTVVPFEPDIIAFSFPVLSPMVEGKLTSVRDVQDQSGKHVLADLQTPDGQTMTLDLGDGTAARQSLKLQNGDWIAATGTMGTVNGQQVLVADHVASVASIEPSGSSGQPASPAGATLGGQSRSPNSQQ
jgi:hypothetical protein